MLILSCFAVGEAEVREVATAQGSWAPASLQDGLEAQSGQGPAPHSARALIGQVWRPGRACTGLVRQMGLGGSRGAIGVRKL